MDKETEKAMKKDNILHLTLKKKYFDEILSGKKKKEFREFKPYWISRLCTRESIESWGLEFKEFEKIIFKNGYKKNAPSFEIELKKIEVHYGIDTPIGKGDFFVIHFGEIIK